MDSSRPTSRSSSATRRCAASAATDVEPKRRTGRRLRREESIAQHLGRPDGHVSADAHGRWHDQPVGDDLAVGLHFPDAVSGYTESAQGLRLVGRARTVDDHVVTPVRVPTGEAKDLQARNHVEEPVVVGLRVARSDGCGGPFQMLDISQGELSTNRVVVVVVDEAERGLGEQTVVRRDHAAEASGDTTPRHGDDECRPPFVVSARREEPGVCAVRVGARRAETVDADRRCPLDRFGVVHRDQSGSIGTAVVGVPSLGPLGGRTHQLARWAELRRGAGQAGEHARRHQLRPLPRDVGGRTRVSDRTASRSTQTIDETIVAGRGGVKLLLMRPTAPVRAPRRR